MRALLLAAVAFAGLASAASAQTFSFTTIDNPGDPTFNQLLGINDTGTIVGYFGSGMAGHPNIGYKLSPPYTSYQSVMQPGSLQTQATGINNSGSITGFWAPTNTGSDANFGFVREPLKVGAGPVSISAVFPGVYGATQLDQALGVNNLGVVAGFYVDDNGVSHAYTYNPAKAVFMPVHVKGSTSSGATGINDNGQISGFGMSPNGHTFGFVQNASGGVQSNFTVPGSTFTQLLGINNNGTAVGFYNDSNNTPHGLYYQASTGSWIAVNDPNGVGGTVVNGINNKNQLVGFYTDAAGNVHGMLVTVTP